MARSDFGLAKSDFRVAKSVFSLAKSERVHLYLRYTVGLSLFARISIVT